MKKILSIFFVMLCVFNVYAYDLYQQPTQRVLDYSNVLSSNQVETLNNQLNDIYQKESQTEIEVLIIPKLQDGLDLVDLNIKLFNSWKLGNKDLNNGVLVTIVTDSNNIRISTGSGLDGVLPDSYLGRIMDDNNIKTRLINKDYYGSINDVVESMNKVIVKEQFGDIKKTNHNKKIMIIIGVIILILVIGIFIPVDDFCLSYYIIYFLVQIAGALLKSGIGGGGGTSGGGSSR